MKAYLKLSNPDLIVILVNTYFHLGVWGNQSVMEEEKRKAADGSAFCYLAVPAGIK